MELTGHSGEVFAARFDPTGRYIASGSMDRSIRLYIADCVLPHVLTWLSALAKLWRMRKLRHSHRPQAGRTGPSLVAGLESALFCIGRHAPRELGRRDGREDTETPWTRRSHQLYGREQARGGDARQWLR